LAFLSNTGEQQQQQQQGIENEEGKGNLKNKGEMNNNIGEDQEN